MGVSFRASIWVTLHASTLNIVKIAYNVAVIGSYQLRVQHFGAHIQVQRFKQGITIRALVKKIKKTTDMET
jgi:hypothetical protein